MKRLRPFAFLIFIALIVYVVSKLNLPSSWDRLKQLNPWLLLLAVVGGVPEYLFKSLRLRSFVARAKSHLSVKQSILTFLSGQPLASVTPGKLGDVSRIVLLNRLGKVSMPVALAVHVADRIYDLAAIVFLGIMGLVYYISTFSGESSALGTFIGMLCGMLLILALINPRWIKFVLKPIVAGLLPKNLASKISHHAGEFNSSLHSLLIPSFKIFGPFVLSVLAWQAAILRSYLLVVALGIPLAYGKFAFLWPIAIVVELLPISILGFGPREMAMFVLFTTSVVRQEDLFAFDLLNVVSGPILTAVVGIPAALHMFPKESHPHAS